MVFISGQTAWDERKNIVGSDSVLEQARQALRNLEKAMGAAGGTLKDRVIEIQGDFRTRIREILLKEGFLVKG